MDHLGPPHLTSLPIVDVDIEPGSGRQGRQGAELPVSGAGEQGGDGGVWRGWGRGGVGRVYRTVVVIVRADWCLEL